MACNSIDWNAVGAVATAVATLVALWFGLNETFRRRRERTIRGRVALSMLLPEIARLVALFDLVEGHYRGIQENPEKLRHHGLTLASLAPAFETPLTKYSPADFCDLPEMFGYNLPTVIHSLRAVAAFAMQTRTRMIGVDGPRPTDAVTHLDAEYETKRQREQETFDAHIVAALDYTHSCSIEFRAAMSYAEKHLLPLQMANMANRLPERFESQPPPKI